MSPDTHDAQPASSDSHRMDRLKEISLKASGIGFLIGDAAFFVADRMNKDNTGSLTGLTYLAGAAVAARYGKTDPQYYFQKLERQLRSYFIAEGIPIPTGAELNRSTLTKSEGMLDQVEAFFRRYPAQILNGMFAVGGGFKVAAGLKKEQGKYSTMAYGGLVMLAGLTGLLVPERKPDPERPPTTLAGKLWENIQAKPLRAASAIYLVNNANLVVHAVQQRKEHLATGVKPGYPLTFLTACAYIVSNGLLGFASKNRDAVSQENGKYIEALEEAAAQVIRAQPQEIQQSLVERVSGFLAAQQDVKQPAHLIAEALTERLQAPPRVQSKQGWQQSVATRESQQSVR